jgi:predicted HAD superfamily Cof-like phosphohydrolase
VTIDQLGDGTYCVNVNEFDPVRDINEFHAKFGLEYTGKPRVLPSDLSRFRFRFMLEELDEYGEHDGQAYDETTRMPQARDAANYAFHLEHLLDALVDLVYVAIGTNHLHGFNFKEAWRRVHAANMSKVRAQRAEDSKRGSTFDVIKPTGWQPPSHIDLVEDNDLMEPHSDRA